MSKTLIRAQRRKFIQEYLTTHKIASIADLSSLVETSEATVRRDLEWLDNEGLLAVKPDLRWKKRAFYRTWKIGENPVVQSLVPKALQRRDFPSLARGDAG